VVVEEEAALVEVGTGKELGRFQAEAPVVSAAVLPDRRGVFVGLWNGWARLFRMGRGRFAGR
jgi:hypothetical protein